MSLIITIVEPDYIWQLSDHRIKKENGMVYDERSIKHLNLVCEDGIALLSWNGVAELSDKTRMSAWLKAILTAKSMTVREAMDAIAKKATEEIGGVSELVVSAGAFVDNEAWYFEVTNHEDGKIRSKFSVKKIKIDKESLFLGGSGQSGVKEAHIKSIKSTLARKTRKPEDMTKTLAEVNKSIASKTDTVSITSTTAYIKTSGAPITTEIH